MIFQQMSLTEVVSTTEAKDIWDTIFNIIEKIPLTELLVGVVVPIVAAWISYALANRATNRKEFNRLFIQIELVEKELIKNQEILRDFTFKYEDKGRLQKSLEIPVYQFRNLLIDVLKELNNIQIDYLYLGHDMVFENPKECYICAQSIESIDTEIKELESSGYGDAYLDDIRRGKLFELYAEKDKLIAELKKSKHRNIYNEFIKIQSFIERNSYGKEFFEKSEISDDNYAILKLIFNVIKRFNDKPNKTVADVSDLYEKLLLNTISSDIIEDDQFNQDSFDLMKLSASPEGFEKVLYDTYEKYYKFVLLDKSVTNFRFTLLDLKWQANSSDLVLISDSKLYIAISDSYEAQIKFQNECNEKLNDEVHEVYNQSKKIDKDISDIVANLKKHKLRIKKWCR